MPSETIYDCPCCGLRGDVELQRSAYLGGQHENDQRCIAFLRGIGIHDAHVMSTKEHDRREAAFNRKHAEQTS